MKKGTGITVWLNEVQYEKLLEAEEEFMQVFGKDLTHGEAIMVSALISRAFTSFFSLGVEMIEKGIVNPDNILNIDYLEKVTSNDSPVLDDLSKTGRQIERLFIQLDALGLLKRIPR